MLVPFTARPVAVALQQHGLLPVLVYNPSSKTRSDLLTLNVPVSWIAVLDAAGVSVPSQLDARADLSIVAPHGRGHQYSFSLTFAVDVPPLGFATYFLAVHQPPAAAHAVRAQQSVVQMAPQQFVLENSVFRILADNVSGVQSVLDKRTGTTHALSVQLRYYQDLHGDAYSYSVNGSSQAFSGGAIRLVSGLLRDELYLDFSNEHSIVVRLHKVGTVDAIELVHELGTPDLNTDIVSVIQTDIASSGVLYTDSNGIDTMQRRNDSSLTMEENTWPATTYAYVQDASTLMAVVLQSVHAVQSLASGQLQLLMHRRSRMLDVSGVVR